MKYLLILFLFASCATAQRVTWNPTDNLVKVYELSGSKNDLFTKANRWMVDVFTDAESVIQHSDKEEGVIIGKYLLHNEVISGAYDASVGTIVYAIIDIRVKDDKARIEIKPQDSWEHWPGSTYSQLSYTQDQAKQEMNLLANSFYESLKVDKVEF